MNKDEILMHKEKSSKFHSEGSAYVHTEMKDGKAPQTILCGDFMAMLFCVEAEISRISELTHTSFEQTLGVIALNHKLGKENVFAMTKDLPRQADAKGSFAEFEADVQKRMDKLNEKNDNKVDELKKQLKHAKADNDILKVKIEKQKEEHFRELQKKEKQILKLDHECDRLTKLLREGK